jgi:N-acetylmuramoyl-L-alanine amidase
MTAGVRNFFKYNAPPGTRLAARKHVIARGDTLGRIAGLYGVTLVDLRKANALKGSDIKVGQVLQIPGISGS